MDSIIKALDAGRDCAIAAGEADYQFAQQLVGDWREQRRSGRGEYPHRYHQNWNQGGPIIEREGVLFTRTNDGEMYHAWIVRLNASATGPTHLTAAMRCFVESRLGDEVDVPEELI